ncbi:hypothetical protein Lal_00047998 [Lupinus albus]|nr:hypothetical protein Lal_00047998 [Lupinus albus]
MEQSRPKRVKTSATCVRRREVGSPSARDRGDPYYSLILQETRMAKFQGRKPTYIRYVDLTWLSEQNFSFPHDMEAQGTIQFMELKGQVYPALVREFYANFRYKDGKYWSMISGNLFELNDEIFMNVGGLSSSGYSIGDCSWGQLTKAGSLSVENRLLHYIIAYILVQRNTNHAQPTVNDLRFIIFISRIVDYLRIDVSDTIIVEYTDKDHLVGESLIHKMDDTDNQHATAQGEPSGSAPQNLLLDSISWKLWSNGLTTESDSIYAEAQNALFCSEFQKLSMLIRGDQNIVTSADHTDDPHPPPQP